MTDKLRAAANRRRAMPGWKGMAYPYPTAVDDAVLLADAYLAEHPVDDDEPVTEEWLRSVGFIHYETSIGYPHFEIVGRLPCVLFGTRRVLLDLSAPFKGWGTMGWNACVNQGGSWIGRRENRADVRRLCKALGIELKEGG